MPSYKEVFPNSHTVLPVIHVESPRQAIRNAEIAHKEGADGAFLISMKGMDHEDLSELHETVKKEFATWWIGVNYLDLPAVRVFQNLNNGISGVWADNAQILEFVKNQINAETIKEARRKSGWEGLYFGGVAFKYQSPVANVERAAQIATKYMDVVTTSGSGTGFAPDKDKISRMKLAIGEHPLAIASGISPDNVRDFLDADCFLVATSLLVPGKEEFDPSRVRDLINAVRG